MLRRNLKALGHRGGLFDFPEWTQIPWTEFLAVESQSKDREPDWDPLIYADGPALAVAEHEPPPMSLDSGGTTRPLETLWALLTRETMAVEPPAHTERAGPMVAFFSEFWAYYALTRNPPR